MRKEKSRITLNHFFLLKNINFIFAIFLQQIAGRNKSEKRKKTKEPIERVEILGVI